ncbi:N-acetyltransferase family protein [Aerosakkonemataceae cyanobacterium BLCC-F50]|uniref:N-acetyltransferase family protein n=1 Tax=Floridaenema flaviceps BLCC-F50 TaxID=3153642 RepID=A0ABV4XP15_9CYAN
MIMIVREATHNDVPAIARVHVDTWRSTYQGIVPDEHLAKLSYEQRANFWHQIFHLPPEDSNFTFVAEEESSKIVGFANGGVERTGDPLYKGELNAIYILQIHQGKGIGRCLVQAVAKMLIQLGIKSMLVWVLVDNPACQFYTALGGEPVREKEIEIGGKRLIEVAYGWKNLENFGYG